MQRPAFWLAVGKIIWINVLLSGDNALVIAMACRGLAPRQRLWGMVIGAGIAVVLLIAFTGIVATLMVLPYLKLAGGLALLVIAAKLLVPEDEGGDVTAGASLWHAVRIVVIADIVMSLDNVIAVAAAAGDSTTLLILGLAISIPLVIFGSTLLIKVMERFPIVITVGAALIGFVAGEMVVTDPALGDWMSANFQMVDKKPMLAGFHLEVIVGLAGALLVVLVGKLLARRQTAAVGESQEIPR